MVEVPSTALDMGNEEHHHGNWRASQDIRRCHQGECLVTLHKTPLQPRIVLSVSLRAWDPVLISVL